MQGFAGDCLAFQIFYIPVIYLIFLVANTFEIGYNKNICTKIQKKFPPFFQRIFSVNFDRKYLYLRRHKGTCKKFTCKN